MIGHANAVQEVHHKARIEQVPCRVLLAPYIHVDGEEGVCHVGGERRQQVVWNMFQFFYEIPRGE